MTTPTAPTPSTTATTALPAREPRALLPAHLYAHYEVHDVDMTPERARRFHRALWATQLALALVFAVAGIVKLALPMPQLIAALGWPQDFVPGFVRFIGICEIAGAVGLLLPAALRVLPWATSLAATGLALLSILATALHIIRGELWMTPLTLALAAAATFVSWARVTVIEIEPRDLGVARFFRTYREQPA